MSVASREVSNARSQRSTPWSDRGLTYGALRRLFSNCAGNFYVTAERCQPAFPLQVEVSHGGVPEPMIMESKIGRDG